MFADMSRGHSLQAGDGLAMPVEPLSPTRQVCNRSCQLACCQLTKSHAALRGGAQGCAVEIVPYILAHGNMAILAQHAVALISAQLVDLATAGMLAVCDMTQSSVRVVVSVWGMCRERGAVAGKGPPQPLNGHA